MKKVQNRKTSSSDFTSIVTSSDDTPGYALGDLQAFMVVARAD
jgi:hypothetical protein